MYIFHGVFGSLSQWCLPGLCQLFSVKALLRCSVCHILTESVMTTRFSVVLEFFRKKLDHPLLLVVIKDYESAFDAVT